MIFYNVLTARIHLSVSRRVISSRYDFISRDTLKGRLWHGDRWNRSGRGAHHLEREQLREYACRVRAFAERLTSSLIGAVHCGARLPGLSFREYALALVLKASTALREDP